ncbi:hypothetical protein [Streptomyces sp. NPDC000880]
MAKHPKTPVVVLTLNGHYWPAARTNTAGHDVHLRIELTSHAI